MIKPKMIKRGNRQINKSKPKILLSMVVEMIEMFAADFIYSKIGKGLPNSRNNFVVTHNIYPGSTDCLKYF
jgi:hypothetical protein